MAVSKAPIFIIKFVVRLFCAMSCCLFQSAQANQLFDDSSQWAIDLSSRTIHDSDSDITFNQNVLGFDYYQVFANENGDIGSLVFQPYLVSLNNHPKPPAIFDDGDDETLTWRIVSFNYYMLSQGRMNLRMGHLELPYGLEKNIDTNGTLRQFTAGSRGIKADWGFSLNGQVAGLDYEVAVTRGSGNDIDATNDPGLLTGRFGSLANKNTVYGVSWMTGKTLHGDTVIERDWIGVDFTHYFYQWALMAELNHGEESGETLRNALVEGSWQNALENLKVFVQLKSDQSKPDGDWQSRSSASAGVQWLPAQRWDLSAQFQHALNDKRAGSVPTQVSVQGRYRW